jgi:hypothetical protein
MSRGLMPRLIPASLAAIVWHSVLRNAAWLSYERFAR